MAKARRKVLKSLKSKGFKEDTGSHHIWLFYENTDGILTRIRTKLSHSKRSKDLGAYHIGKMAKQCKLSTRDFELLAKCPMQREEYEARVQEHF